MSENFVQALDEFANQDILNPGFTVLKVNNFYLIFFLNFC